MEAVCIKGSWDVLLEKDQKNNLIGVLVFHIRKYRGFTLILMPPMTAYNGLYFFYPEGTKDHSKVSYQNKLSEKLISRLPKCSLYYQQFHPAYNNWLSLYWKNYKQTTRYTYILDKSEGEQILKQNLKGNLRRSFKYIEEECQLENHGFETFWPELERAFSDRKKTIPYNKQVLQNLFSSFKDSPKLTVKACRHIQSNEILAGVVLASDKNTTYYIASYFKAKAKPAGAMGYLMWKSIFEAKTKYCDFEGSMLKEVEFFLRSFGGQLTPHYKIYKVHNPMLKWALRIFKPDFFG